MRMRTVVALFVLAVASSASAQMIRSTVLELAEQCDVAFSGTVLHIDKDTATIRLEHVLY